MTAACLLSACGKSKPFANPAVDYLIGGAGYYVEPLPREVSTCPAPAEIPWTRVKDDILPIGDVLQVWGRDRASLVTCRNNLRSVVVRYDGVRTLVNQAGAVPSLVK